MEEDKVLDWNSKKVVYKEHEEHKMEMEEMVWVEIELNEHGEA